MPAAAMNAEEIAKLLHEVFPQGFYPGCGLAIERVDYASVRVRTRLLKVGKRLAVGEVTIFSDGMSEPVAHVNSTYSIPANGN